VNKVELLRHIVANLHVEPLRMGLITQEQLDQSPFARARLTPEGNIGILRAGGEALSDLADTIFRGTPEYLRGCTFEELSDELFGVLIQNFRGRRGPEITAADVTFVDSTLEDWFKTKSASHHLYVPCILTPRPAPAFDIGPVRFTYVTDFVTRERTGKETMFDFTYGMMLQEMGVQRAFWIAEVDVRQCMQKRAEELGELAVDIAIAGLQLVIHPDQSRHMARMTARTVPRYRFGVSVGNGMVSPTVRNQEPGILLGPGTLEHYLKEGSALLSTVGSQVSAFLTRAGDLPTLSCAWADAAYWYHEGLAELLDTIAVPKLETGIEVLLRSESSSGSTTRIVEAIGAFYGLKPDQFINPNSQITVKQFAAGFVRDRSRILHGTWSTLVHSLRASRGSLESLVLGVLAGYVFELQAYCAAPGSADDLDQFLSFVIGRRAAI
jgi:hypothetical protein